MLALVFDGQTLNLQRDYPEPIPAADEALIQVRMSGICATDLEILRGYADFHGVLGHEFVGEVLACQQRPDLVGQRVVGDINIGCGHCDFCRGDHPEHCLRRTAIGIRNRDGVFAERLTLPAANLHVVPDNLPDEAAVFVEPLAAVVHIREQVTIRPSDRVVVLGAGRLGQLAARSLAVTGCHLVVVGRHPRKLALLQAAGIKTALPGELPPQWACVAIECTGHPGGFADALTLIRPQGALVLKSTYASQAEIDLSRVVVDEIQVVGSRCGPFAPALRMLAAGDVDPLPLVEATYRLEDGLQALEHAGRRGVLKVLMRHV